MSSTAAEEQVPIQTPLCKKHFQQYARRQIALEIEADNAVEAQKETEKPPQPTRIQPRRAAKDRYLQAKVEAKKRKAEEALAEAKRRKTTSGDEFEDSDSWTSFAISLDQMETRAINQAKRRMPQNCPFGAVPWVCNLCVEEVAKLSKEISPGSPPIAPVASMVPIDEQLKLHSRARRGK
ncbi:hypothetical protein N0V84_002058 [Fusarium piperis]|uniref:Uncharacterized protein n=1 Tax=Fusarium piperis TaxID=1435070 RepID=A0A9W9BTD4_9HYPO|nr:hypothetical protein N0V84_002058 [Fusarium piperis]